MNSPIVLVLILGGLAVGGYFLYKKSQETPAAAATNTSGDWSKVALAGVQGGTDLLKNVFSNDDPYYY